MNPALLANPLFTVTLPMMVTFTLGTWAIIANNNQLGKRIDAIEKRLGSIEGRLTSIEARLTSIEADHGARLAVLEDRTRIVR